MNPVLQPFQKDDREDWDAFVLRHGGGFLQSWGWSQFQEAVGRTAYRFRLGSADEDSGEKTVAQFVLIRHALPLGASYVYLPRGPVMAGGRPEEKQRAFGAFAHALRAALPQFGALFARIEPPFVRGIGAYSEDLMSRAGFAPVKAVQPADTVIIDLDRSEEELLAAMHPKTRYNIHLAERHGVVIKDAEYGNAHLFKHDVELFWRLLGETSGRDQFHTHARGYYEKMLDVLSPRKAGALKLRLVFALYNEEPAAAAIVAEFGDTVTYLHGASSARLRQFMAPFRLHWEIMRQAKERGFVHYDLWGVAPEGAGDDHPWAGITRFKTGFGGRRESYLGSWELTMKPFWYNLYRMAKRFKNV